jgi:hypothetical protein
MKNLKCENLKMLAMEAFDGEISPENSLILKAHLEICPGCREYADDLGKMKALIPVYEPPKGLSEKIMNSVIKADMKTEKAPQFRPFAGFAAASAAAFVLTLLIVTTTADKDSVTIADMPAEKPAMASVKPAVKQEPKKEAEPVIIAETVKEQAVPVTAKIEVPLIETEKGPGAERVTTIADKPAETQKPSYEVNKVSEPAYSLAAAKVTPITPPDNRLLDTEKAIVGNNVVNVSRGERAIIRVKVEEVAQVRIIIYDKRIKPVSVILDEQKEPGVYEAFWYGKNDLNQAVTEGVYFVYVQIGRTVVKKNVVVTR